MTLILLATLTALTPAWGAPPPAATQPPAMLNQNAFTRPEDVMKHYCERDSWGFIWSGWAKDERQALALWQSSPLPETIYVIRKFEVLPAQIQGSTAKVEVLYDVVVTTDGHGGLIAKGPKTKRVIYQLKKVAGQWKIESPSPLKQAAYIRHDRYPVKLPKGVTF